MIPPSVHFMREQFFWALDVSDFAQHQLPFGAVLQRLELRFVAAAVDPCHAVHGSLVQIGRVNPNIPSLEHIMQELVLATMIPGLIIGTALWIG